MPYAIYLLHIFLFRDWIVDDAGISFAYARNLAQGFGLVSQPGLEPVEGYSNFTWVLLLVPFFWLKLFHPIIIPKLLSIFLVFSSFIILQKTFRLISKNPFWITFFCLLLLSINTSFIVWTTSGLENPLYIFLAVILLNQMINLSLVLKNKTVIIISILASLLAMTRPDGILYFFVFVIFMLVNHASFKSTVVNIGVYLAVFTLIYGSFLLFRLLYFKDFFPNPYYVKGGPAFDDLINLLLLKPEIQIKIYQLFNSVVTFWGSLFFLGLSVITAYLIYLKFLTKQHFVLILMLIFSGLTYILLPYDWMGEFRFATSFIILFYVCLLIFAERLIQIVKWQTFGKIIFTGVFIVAFILPSIIDFANRTYHYRLKQAPSFTWIARYVNRYNNYVSMLNVNNASLLLPDIGGAIYYSRLRIYDFGGLTNKTIAKTMMCAEHNLFKKREKDFYDYIFEKIKPTFIHTHGVWTYRAKFDMDERFRRDYIPITEKIEKSDLNKNGRLKLYSGEYIRKDVVNGNLEIFQKITQPKTISN